MKTNPWEDKYQEIMKNQQNESMDFSMDDLIEKAENENPKRPMYYWIGGIAASVLMLFVVGFFWMNNYNKSEKALVVKQNKMLPIKDESIQALPIQMPDLKEVTVEPIIAKIGKSVKLKKTQENEIKPQEESIALVYVNGRPIYDKEMAMEEANYALTQVNEKLKKVSKYTKKVQQLMIKI